jgi:hypothetical protein
MWSFDTFSDRFYVVTRLYFKLDLVPSRETLLHFFDHVRRTYPGMRRFRRREDGAVTLDEGGPGDAQRRYVRVGNQSLRFGQIGPADKQAVASFAEMMLTHSPYHLSLSDLDYDSLEVAFGFDLEYSGNHDELVAETLLGESPLQANFLGAEGRVIDCQPCLGFALTEDCATQAYIDVRGRTSMYELRSEEYEPQLLSVRLTVRRYFRNGAPADLNAVHQELLGAGEAIAAGRVVPQIVLPLREAIASRR